MDDDVYRAFLQSTVGKTSCKEMNIAELLNVLRAMKDKGFEPTATSLNINADRSPLSIKRCI
ncbi:phage protein GemA/Gp16 family protein [Pasteurella multocida]|uniref:phage protein GemA/Gp16 family protein n=1 Tax=Pasteurella multocida TaxID=747 RepID=UPI0037C62742